MPRTRRQFLADAGCGLGTAALFSAMGRFSLLEAATTGSATDYRALVCVFLYGGNDGNNTVIPYDEYATYARVRGTSLNIPKASLLQVPAPSQRAAFGLHPSLVEMKDLYDAGKVAVLCNVGTLLAPLTRQTYLAGLPRPDSLFSHADQQSQWQSAVVRTTDLNARTGWGGRTADAAASLNAVGFPMVVSVSGIPLFTTGATARPLVPGAGLQGFPNTPAARDRYTALRGILGGRSSGALVQAENDLTLAAIDDNALLSAALGQGPAPTTAFPATPLGKQLQQIAAIVAVRGELKVNRQIFFASLGSFDTHTDEINTQESLLTQVSQALKAFYDATVELGVATEVTTFTLSDFGRTFLPASGGGTDHAWGSHHFILGGSVRGGDFYGTFQDLTISGPDDASYEGRWIPSTSVDEYGATLARWYGVEPAAIPAVFPNIGRFAARDLRFLP